MCVPRRAEGWGSGMSHTTTPYVACSPSSTLNYDYVMDDGIESETFAELIRTAREAKGWSQEQLERATADGRGEHVSVSTISRWERGQAGRPEPSHVRMVCRALGIDPRRAAVALGYLTQDEISGGDNRLSADLEEILAILADPAIPASAKEEWKRYLRFLQASSRSQAG